MQTLFVVAFLLVASSVVNAQSFCAPRETLLNRLAREYQEVPTGVGLAYGGGVLELLTSVSGTWTLMATKPGGLTCLIATGQAWQGARCEPAKPREEDS